MQQTSDRIIETQMNSTRHHLHHPLEILGVTTHPTGTLISTAAILHMLVLLDKIEHPLGKEKGNSRTARVGTDKVGQEKENKVAGRVGLEKGSPMGIGQGKNQNNSEPGHVLSPTPGVIEIPDPQLGQPLQTNNAPKVTESPPPQATQMTLVLDLGPKMVKECVFHRGKGPPHSSLRVGTTQEAAKDNPRSNVATVATGHVLALEDARATLLTGVGLAIGKVLQASPAEAPAETEQDFVHIVVDLSVRWQNAMFLKRKSYLTFHVNFVLPSYCTERVPIARLFRITGPPQQ